ncbi:hypothetical protein NTCA1_53400 [Novosphingobium sp. TCA1]|nr:hypothetical protein NTCA1_53400 [Novosphingobium sp. TCA1]
MRPRSGRHSRHVILKQVWHAEEERSCSQPCSTGNDGMGAEGPILSSGGGSHRSPPPVCRSDRDDDLADLFVRFEEAVRVLDGVEREGARDPRL